ncbi:DNA repair protein [Tenacibaculum maritimum]|uniref:antitoxin HicB n=1 Tax=Tenacibaculum maritimum TaxID=107401 RepID=UPI001330BDDC|nr:antitoxin HicB [Tenacibaculum maritimum]
MKRELTHKGYVGSTEYDEKDNMYFGKVTNITNLVSYEGNSEKELEENLKKAVQDYLEMVK